MKKLEISSLENIQGGCCVNPCNLLGGALGCLGNLVGCLALGASLSAGGCGCGGVSVGVGVCVSL
jgi:hypothetical protein